MAELLGVVVPHVIQAEQLERQIRDAYYVWRAGYDKAHPVEPIRNVAFTHDENWRTRFMSIQNMHDGNTWFWKATHIVVRFGALASGLSAMGMF